MLFLAIAIGYSSGLPLIVAAGAAMYIASKALSDAMTDGVANRPGRLAIGQWLPIATLAVAAAAINRTDIAVGLIFSTAVATLSLALGSVSFVGSVPMATSTHRTWAMLVPAGLLVFLVGFRTTISPFGAGVMLLQGLCVLLLWTDRTSPATEEVSQSGSGLAFRFIQFLLAIALAGIGAWMALHGIDQVALNSEFASAGLLTATLLSPLLVLPIIGTGTELAQQKQSTTAVSSQVGVALLNACVLLPLVVLTSYARQFLDQKHAATLQFIPVTFPLAVWRVDVIIFIALGLFLLPVAIGRWSIRRLQGLGLMLGYVLYLALSILIGVRRV